MKHLTLKKQQLKYREGGAEQIRPAGDYKAAQREYDESPSDDPIEIDSVSIAVVTKMGKKLVECELMHDNIVVPDAECMFYIKFKYPWRIKSGAQDRDEILTDGEQFLLVNRNLARCPFVLNDYSKAKLTDAITKFVEKI